MVRGDGRDPGTLAEALARADAAISLLPGGGGADPHLASTAARALITAMTRTGVGDRPRPHSRADTAAVLLDLAERPAPARTAVNVTGA